MASASRPFAFVRFLFDIRRLARGRVTLDEARRRLAHALEHREANFLSNLRTLIVANPRSPYTPLLAEAQCELGDIERSVQTNGLEGALLELRRAGVYVGFEEFKGREPVVRNGHELGIRPEHFDNPQARRSIGAAGGGSTGARTPIFIDIDGRIDQGILRACADTALGFGDYPASTWWEVLPSHVGVMALFQRAVSSRAHEHWFTPGSDYPLFARFKHRLATETVVAAARLWGLRVPRPERVALDDAVEIARWAADRARSAGGAVVQSTGSRGVRIAAAANEHGIDLSGVVITVGSEPFTEAKAVELAKSGARAVPVYHVGEAGCIGVGCGNPVSANDLHFCRHALALIAYPRGIAGSDTSVDTFHLTSLLPTSPKVLLNVETDDYGVLEERACGCGLEALGFHEHIRDVFSFSKLTGEGVTLVGSDAVRILEEVLPATFGGTSLDYQLQEEEDASGLTRLTLVVSPRVSLDDEGAVVATFLDALGSRGIGGSVRSAWKDAGTMRVVRAEPRTTAAGKLLPLMRTRREERNAQGR